MDASIGGAFRSFGRGDGKEDPPPAGPRGPVLDGPHVPQVRGDRPTRRYPVEGGVPPSFRRLVARTTRVEHRRPPRTRFHAVEIQVSTNRAHAEQVAQRDVPPRRTRVAARPSAPSNRRARRRARRRGTQRERPRHRRRLRSRQRLVHPRLSRPRRFSRRG